MKVNETKRNATEKMEWCTPKMVVLPVSLTAGGSSGNYTDATQPTVYTM
jgi:hypothetical protein